MVVGAAVVVVVVFRGFVRSVERREFEHDGILCLAHDAIAVLRHAALDEVQPVPVDLEVLELLLSLGFERESDTGWQRGLI